MTIQVKRVYDAAEPADGARVLVDRVWPRGISKERAQLSLWAKAVTPSTGLRRWYHEDREGRWVEFRERFEAELAGDPAAKDQLTELRRLAKDGTLTLLTAVPDPDRSHVTVLVDVLRSGLPHG